MSRRKENAEDSNFWVSYSDLATGLMIVFMVVMLIMVIIQKDQTERQTERISEITAKLEIILGEKSKLSESVNMAFKDDPSVKADPVTAQISIDEDALRFAENQALLQDHSLQFLQKFTPQYICSLWAYEHHKCGAQNPNCNRMDPETVGGVRRIQVTGHADMKGFYGNNHRLSSARAEEVVQQMIASLNSDNPNIANLRQDCQEHLLFLKTYAQERLWAVGAGETQHCTKELNRNLAVSEKILSDCDSISGDDNSFRKVDFRLELTGDDMTGLLADVVALRKEVGQSDHSSSLDVIADEVASRCWEDPQSYHGCHVFARDCLNGNPSQNCNTLLEKYKSDLGIKNLVKSICRKENLIRCP